MVDKKILNLNFLTSYDTNVRVTINKPILNLSSKEVSLVMDQIISYGVLEGVMIKKSAEYVTSSMESVKL